MTENKHLPLKLVAPARAETADGWSINLPWTRHGDDDPYADAEAFAPVLVEAVNAYHSNQSEIERLRGLLRSARSYVSDVACDDKAFLQEEAMHDLASIDAALNTEGQGNG